MGSTLASHCLSLKLFSPWWSHFYPLFLQVWQFPAFHTTRWPCLESCEVHLQTFDCNQGFVSYPTISVHVGSSWYVISLSLSLYHHPLLLPTNPDMIFINRLASTKSWGLPRRINSCNFYIIEWLTLQVITFVLFKQKLTADWATRSSSSNSWADFKD